MQVVWRLLVAWKLWPSGLLHQLSSFDLSGCQSSLSPFSNPGSKELIQRTAFEVDRLAVYPKTRQEKRVSFCLHDPHVLVMFCAV